MSRPITQAVLRHPPPAATVSLTVLGSPHLGYPWAVQATPHTSGPVSVQFWINGALAHTEHTSPYCPFGDNGVSCDRVEKPPGYYTMEVRVLSNGTEVARQALVVTATEVPSPAATVSLTMLGSPNLGQPWTVQATPHASGPVSVQFWINGVLTHTEDTSPYCAFGDNGVSCTRVEKPFGHYTMEVRVLSNGTEVARQALVVTAT